MLSLVPVAVYRAGRLIRRCVYPLFVADDDACISFASDPAQRPSFAALLESLEKELGTNMQAGTLKLLTQSSAAGADGRKSWFGSSSMWSGSSSAPLNSAGAGSGGATMATLGGGAGDQGGHYYQ